MKAEQVLVVSVNEEDVSVVPMIKGDCASCASGCEKRGSPYSVQNPRKLPVTAGNVVIVGAGATAQAIQGIISLLVPFLVSVLAYVFSPIIAPVFGLSATEGFKAVSVLVGLFISALAVFLITRKVPLPGKSEILEICPN